jgi:glutamate/tyrosine decarboxylase-like PLP-dependent enzyme
MAFGRRPVPASAFHVDAVTGGFLAPFIEPDVFWVFRLPRAKPVSASGRGWALWSDADVLPEDLIFDVELGNCSQELGGESGVRVRQAFPGSSTA